MSRLVLKGAALLSATATLLASSVASATNYSLWIHGRNTSQSTKLGNYTDFSYWGPSAMAAGINKKSVNWNGVGHISDTRAVGDAISSDLRTAAMRSLYNHNTTRGKWFYLFAGAKGKAYSGALPGQDDEAVAYHSSGGVSATGGFCNPGDWFCDGDLNTGTTGSSNAPKWTNHSVEVRDDGEFYNHYTSGSWGGIMGAVRKDMASFAY